MIAFVNTIIFVKNIERSKKFYTDVLGLKITEDFGTIVFFENHLVIHNAGSIAKTVFGKNKLWSARLQGKDNLLVYFETDDLEEAYRKIEDCGCKIIHRVKIGVLICYDNLLPENSHLIALKGADILLAPHQTGGTDSLTPGGMQL